MTKKLTTIAQRLGIKNCVCGSMATVLRETSAYCGVTLYRARCLDDRCWEGPGYTERDKSIEAWNTLMGMTANYKQHGRFKLHPPELSHN